jgi:hypothetical protein
VTFPTVPYKRAAGIRIRPVWEWDGCLVFDPAQRRLLELNLHAWLILELCDGQSVDALAKEYRALAEPRIEAGAAERQLARGLRSLAAYGLIEASPHQQ